MIHALKATKLVQQKSNIFDEPIPNDPTPVLQPRPWRPSNIALKNKQNIKKFAAKKTKDKKFFTMDMQKNKDFGEWLLNYIPPKPKVVVLLLIQRWTSEISHFSLVFNLSFFFTTEGT